VGLAVIDGEAKHGQGIGGTVLFVRIGGPVGGDESQFQHEIGVGRSLTMEKAPEDLRPL